jgi:hypothetical protein
MASQIVPIHRASIDLTANNNKTGIRFNAFNFIPEQDKDIRWLSRPNQQLVQQKYSQNAEKFRIQFDAENFQPEQIKVNLKKKVLFTDYIYSFRSMFKIIN